MSALESEIYDILLLAGLAGAAATFVTLFFVAASYGRHARAGWGPSINARWGWVIMEAPAALTMPAWVLVSTNFNVSIAALIALWELHYIHRAFIFPFRSPKSERRNPLGVIAMAFLFNTWNGYLNGRHLGVYAVTYEDLLTLPRFWAGLSLFMAGLAINWIADTRLLQLRKASNSYQVPRGGLFEYVSCPNYLGECIEWIGWVLMAWSPAAIWFAVWTIANLAPRARTHHRWYRHQFPDYPAARRALVPFIY